MNKEKDTVDIIYNCGYYSGMKLRGKTTGKTYIFKKRYVVTVDKEDAKDFLAKTSKDVQWCEQHDKDIPPFMLLEDWCSGKKGAYRAREIKYNPIAYKKEMSL